MVLVSPKLQTAEDHARNREALAKHGFVYDDDRATLVQTGVYITHFNFDHDLRLYNKIDEYPEFGSDDWMERLLKKNVDENPGNDYHREKLAAYYRIPKDPTLFNREAWRHVWENDIAQYVDEPDEIKRLKNERPFEDYEPYLNSYGVCDSVEQLLNMYDFERDPRNLVIGLAPVYKEHQPATGGWRWHKWGPYLGTHKIRYEYLYNEEGIDMVYCFHIHELLGEK